VVWVLLTVFILITGAGLWLSALNGFQSGVTFALMFVIVFSTMLGVGLIIISRQLSNVIGWLLVVAGFSSALFTLSSEYAQIALFSEGQNLTLGLISAWIAQWIWIGYAASLLLGLPLLFPNGRFLSPRWRLYGWFTAFYILLLWISIAFRPGPLTDFTSFDNPFGVRTFEDTPSFLSQAINLLTAVGLRRTPGMTPLALPFITGAILSLILRYRRSQGDQRAQIKWFTFAACLLLDLRIAGDSVHPGDRDRDVKVSPLRDRPDHPPHASLWCFNLIFDYFVLFQRGAAAAGIQGAYRAGFTGRHCDLDVGDCSPVQSITEPGAERHRPALLPPQVRRPASHGSLCCRSAG
jgi:hypothetical protein